MSILPLKAPPENNLIKVKQERNKIEVQAYAGYRGAERPVSFCMNNKQFDIAEILSAWIEPGGERFFRVRAQQDGAVMTIYYDETVKEWFKC